MLELCLYLIIFFVFLMIGLKCGSRQINMRRLGIFARYDKKVPITIFKNLRYGLKPANIYDLYLPSKGKLHYNLIMHIHGGGFNAGDKKEAAPLMKYFASLGYVSASVNYTLMNREHTSNINTMYEEVTKALREIVKTVNEKGYSLKTMAVCGEAAGGSLAMLLAYRFNKSSPLPIKLLFAESAPSGFNPDFWGASDVGSKVEFVSNITGHKFEGKVISNASYQKAIDSVSPVAYIRPDSIMTILAYGAKDKMVPPVLKDVLLGVLETYKVPHKCFVLPNSGNALLNDKEMLDEYHQAVLEALKTYLN